MFDPISAANASRAIASLIGRAVKAQKNPAKPSSKKSSSTNHLADVIASRAEELDPDAGDYRSKLLRLVIEASLLQEFGNNLMNAPKFQNMVDQVLHELESSPQLKNDINAMVNMLTTG